MTVKLEKYQPNGNWVKIKSQFLAPILLNKGRDRGRRLTTNWKPQVYWCDREARSIFGDDIRTFAQELREAADKVDEYLDVMEKEGR